jgi:hypothetical protein
MKTISYLLVFPLLLQSCSVYRTPTTVEEAVVSDKKAKVFTTDNQKYLFTRLENENNRLIGITRLGSSTAQKLAGMPGDIDGQYVRLDLSGIDIEKIMLRSESSSKNLTIVTIVTTVILTAVAIFLISFAQSDIWPEGTNE